MTSNVGRQLKDFGQGVGFGTAAKLLKLMIIQKYYENALKKTFAPNS
jgi:ATP-dependent Clp protease ATP-binding subunit ClpC